MTGTERPPGVDAVVVGGGFYGAHIAAFLSRRLKSVVLFEREPTLLSRASYHNQARVHGGYHYPRSILTSLRSRRNYPRFIAEYGDGIDRTFTKLYAMSRRQSKVTAAQFAEFCRRIDAPIAPAEKGLAAQFDADMIEAVFTVEEAAFDARRLAVAAERSLVAARVAVHRGTEVRAIEPGVSTRVRVRWGEGATDVTDASWVFLCTYSGINDVLSASGLPLVPLVHEITEMAIVEPPAVLRGLGITVMDGPFWSCMPFPPLQAHSLSHVRYTPHSRWSEGGAEPRTVRGDDLLRQVRSSRAPHMQRDAARYVPAMASARYLRSLWEVKTILPRSDVDDSRPILARPVEGAPGAVAILGAKIDSVYDVEDALTTMLDQEGLP